MESRQRRWARVGLAGAEPWSPRPAMLFMESTPELAHSCQSIRRCKRLRTDLLTRRRMVGSNAGKGRGKGKMSRCLSKSGPPWKLLAPSVPGRKARKASANQSIELREKPLTRGGRLTSCRPSCRSSSCRPSRRRCGVVRRRCRPRPRGSRSAPRGPCDAL